MTNFTGTKGDDNFTGTTGDDFFDLTQGGHDTASGLKGNDFFVLGEAFGARDHIDGGDGYDRLAIRGDYSRPIIFTADTLRNVEVLDLDFQSSGGHYNFTTVDATVAAGKTFTIDARSSGGLVFDGSAETDGNFVILLSHQDQT